MKLFVLALTALVLAAAPALAAEEPVDPYVVSDANAGATPITDPGVLRAFHGKDGLDRVVARSVVLYRNDPRLSDIFHAADFERLQRLLGEQFCYLLGGPCHYTGRDMAAAHKDMGLQARDFDALVEDLQKAMDEEHVPSWAQNKLLAKLAPMKRAVVTR